MDLYYTIKLVHLSSVVLSISGFMLRGYWMMSSSPLLQARAAKILPHIIDTVLLASALLMVYMSAQYPFVESWLTVKVFALIAYIVLGTIALKRGKTRQIRIMAWILSVLVFIYIALVALTRTPLIFN
ncbi:MAG: SirB2 family protein [Gammaproteobacteria bacterium]|nr:SirB2 family protein [Gammaproteobacteria bacterium]MCW8911140.1 SirB2 family protein [Gammaproteobacteria bacterium]MCW9004955.1 SirB2 family protein [Gammaproteobacteria bacterium]